MKIKGCLPVVAMVVVVLVDDAAVGGGTCAVFGCRTSPRFGGKIARPGRAAVAMK